MLRPECEIFEKSFDNRQLWYTVTEYNCGNNRFRKKAVPGERSDGKKQPLWEP